MAFEVFTFYSSDVLFEIVVIDVDTPSIITSLARTVNSLPCVILSMEEDVTY